LPPPPRAHAPVPIPGDHPGAGSSSSSTTTTTTGVPVSVTALPFHMPQRSNKGRLKSRVSNFHITLNTNVRIDGSKEEIRPLVDQLQKCANVCFGQEAHFTRFVTFPKGGQWDDEHVIGLDVTTGVEIGKDDAHGRRLHLHVQFKIRHRSYVKLDFQAIKDEMNGILEEEEFPHRIAYVHVTCHKPELADYIGKE
jgi:hypothetical protein